MTFETIQVFWLSSCFIVWNFSDVSRHFPYALKRPKTRPDHNDMLFRYVMIPFIASPNSFVTFHSNVPYVSLLLKSMVFIIYHDGSHSYVINPLIYMF